MLILPVIGGYTQHVGNWDGSQELRELLLAEVRDYSPISVRVAYYEWNENWKQIARQMHLLRLRYYREREPFGVTVCAYSWGVGNGLVNLAYYLKRYGINIQAAVCCDGVYRHPWLTWRAFLDRYRITLPDNVLSAHEFYQRVSLPHGLALVDEDRCLSRTEIILPHVEMDDAPEYHQKCLEVVREQLRIFVPIKTSEPITAPNPETVEVKAEAAKREANGRNGVH